MMQNDIHFSNPDKDVRTTGFFIDELGNKRDLTELCLRKLVLGDNSADGSSVKVIKGTAGDFDGNVWPLKKETRAEKSVERYRNVLSGLIARSAKK
ncbi:TPA: hypothetical protein ACTPQ1_004672 [Salmonella enterica]